MPSLFNLKLQRGPPGVPSPVIPVGPQPLATLARPLWAFPSGAHGRRRAMDYGDNRDMVLTPNHWRKSLADPDRAF